MMTGVTQSSHEVILMKDDSKTNIQVRRATRNLLSSFGNKDDTFDDIINRIIHERNILAIHDVCRNMEEFNKDIVISVFSIIKYTIPATFTEYAGNGKYFQKPWDSEDEALNWAIEMAQDEDFVGSGRESVAVAELVTNVYCLLEEISAPTWNKGLSMKSPF